MSENFHAYVAAGRRLAAEREIFWGFVPVQDGNLSTKATIARPLRVIATCAGEVEPWELKSEHTSLAREVASELQASGQLARLVDQIARNIIDYNHLADRCPLMPALQRRKGPLAIYFAGCALAKSA